MPLPQAAVGQMRRCCHHRFQAGTVELVAETARLWCFLGHHDAQGMFRIDGVTGPDEYSAVADNNVYTNLIAQQNLRADADAAGRHPRPCPRPRDHRGGDGPLAGRRQQDAHPLRRHPRRPPPGRGLHQPPALGFRRHHRGTVSSAAALPYFDLYRKQVTKQADLVLAMHRRSDAFTPAQKARNFAYYEPLTVRDSSLSACS